MQDEICSGNTYKAYKYCSVVAVGRRTHKPMIEIKIAQPGASITRCVAELAGGYSLQKAKTLASFFFANVNKKVLHMTSFFQLNCASQRYKTAINCSLRALQREN